nr:MAG TPA: hypothetical protein [Caudoviricetes sp.]
MVYTDVSNCKAFKRKNGKAADTGGKNELAEL